MATDGTALRLRLARLASRAGFMARRSACAASTCACGCGDGRARSSSHRVHGEPMPAPAPPTWPPAWRRHRVTPAAQARQQVLELGEFDLRLALAALGVLAEDVEDDGGAVDDLHLDDVFECAPLARGELGVGDHGVGAERLHDRGELGSLASTEVGAGVGVRRGAAAGRRAPWRRRSRPARPVSRMEFSASSCVPCV